MSSPVLVSLTQVSKTYGARRAMDGVSLTLGRGEMVALIGPSGAGKSTLLRAVSGLLAIDPGEGRIEAFGEMVQADGRISDKVRATRARIGFIFQQFNLVGRLSLFANTALGLLGRINTVRGLFGWWTVGERQEVMAALARVGVAEQAGQRADSLSGGQQQRAAIARALVQRAEVMLADEPVASLDPVAARRVMALLQDLNRSDGISIIVTLHQVEYALRYCTRAVAMKDGKVAYDGPVSELGHDRLIEIYGPEVEQILPEGVLS